uniref:Uncharacterized protein n=1 Tax=Anopheles coluzzii TaxID=1518534 RepID=A0A8W7PPA3_ANOCL
MMVTGLSVRTGRSGTRRAQKPLVDHHLCPKLLLSQAAVGGGGPCTEATAAAAAAAATDPGGVAWEPIGLPSLSASVPVPPEPAAVVPRWLGGRPPGGRPSPAGPGPKLNALPGTMLAVFSEMADVSALLAGFPTAPGAEEADPCRGRRGGSGGGRDRRLGQVFAKHVRSRRHTFVVEAASRGRGWRTGTTEQSVRVRVVEGGQGDDFFAAGSRSPPPPSSSSSMLVSAFTAAFFLLSYTGKSSSSCSSFRSSNLPPANRIPLPSPACNGVVADP